MNNCTLSVYVLPTNDPPVIDLTLSGMYVNVLVSHSFGCVTQKRVMIDYVLLCGLSLFTLVTNFVEEGAPVYIFPNISVRDVDFFIENISVTLEFCDGGATPDNLMWDTSFSQSEIFVKDISDNLTQLYIISNPGGNPQVYENFLR